MPIVKWPIPIIGKLADNRNNLCTSTTYVSISVWVRGTNGQRSRATLSWSVCLSVSLYVSLYVSMSGRARGTHGQRSRGTGIARCRRASAAYIRRRSCDCGNECGSSPPPPWMMTLMICWPLSFANTATGDDLSNQPRNYAQTNAQTYVHFSWSFMVHRKNNLSPENYSLALNPELYREIHQFSVDWQAISTWSGAGTPPPVHTATALTRRQSTWCSSVQLMTRPEETSGWEEYSTRIHDASVSSWSGLPPPPTGNEREREELHVHKRS